MITISFSFCHENFDYSWFYSLNIFQTRFIQNLISQSLSTNFQIFWNFFPIFACLNWTSILVVLSSWKKKIVKSQFIITTRHVVITVTGARRILCLTYLLFRFRIFNIRCPDRLSLCKHYFNTLWQLSPVTLSVCCLSKTFVIVHSLCDYGH